MANHVPIFATDSYIYQKKQLFVKNINLLLVVLIYSDKKSIKSIASIRSPPIRTDSKMNCLYKDKHKIFL